MRNRTTDRQSLGLYTSWDEPRSEAPVALEKIWLERLVIYRAVRARICLCGVQQCRREYFPLWSHRASHAVIAMTGNSNIRYVNCDWKIPWQNIEVLLLRGYAQEISSWPLDRALIFVICICNYLICMQISSGHKFGANESAKIGHAKGGVYKHGSNIDALW